MQNETQIFPPKEVAMELRKVGFNEQCRSWYGQEHELDSIDPITENHLFRNGSFTPNLFDVCTAPTYDQVIGWFAEVHGIEINYKVDLDFKEYSAYGWHKSEGKTFDTAWYPNRQQSLLTAFREAIKLIQP